VLERLALTAGLVAFFVIGYFGVGLTADPARARSLALAIDERVPFIAGSIWIYLWMFTAATIPVFVVRCRRLFRRTVLAYAVVIAASLLVFALFPVTSTGLRPDPSTLDRGRFDHWAVLVLYAVDPPYNLFPSLHLSIAALAAFSAAKASRRYALPMHVGVALVGVAICTVKQHFVLDGIAGLLLAGAADRVFLRPYRPQDGEVPAFGWRGPAAYGIALALVYGGLYVAFRWAS
jgi:membrane-associated phospholipid phosphatase